MNGWRLFTVMVVAACFLLALATYEVAWGVDFVSSCGPTSGNSSSPSVSCSISDGDFLTVTLYMESPQTVVTAMWNTNEALDYQTEFHPTGESTEYRVYYLAGGTAGSFDIDFSLSGSTPWSLSADVYSGVDGTSPFFGDDSAGGSGVTSIDTSVTPDTGRTNDWMVCGGATGNAGYNVQSGATERQQILSHASEYGRWSDSAGPISGSTTVTHESTTGSNNLGAWCAVLQDSGASTPTPTPSPGVTTADLSGLEDRLAVVAFALVMIILVMSAHLGYKVIRGDYA